VLIYNGQALSISSIRASAERIACKYELCQNKILEEGKAVAQAAALCAQYIIGLNTLEKGSLVTKFRYVQHYHCMLYNEQKVTELKQAYTNKFEENDEQSATILKLRQTIEDLQNRLQQKEMLLEETLRQRQFEDSYVAGQASGLLGRTLGFFRNNVVFDSGATLDERHYNSHYPQVTVVSTQGHTPTPYTHKNLDQPPGVAQNINHTKVPKDNHTQKINPSRHQAIPDNGRKINGTPEKRTPGSKNPSVSKSPHPGEQQHQIRYRKNQPSPTQISHNPTHYYDIEVPDASRRSVDCLIL